MKISKRSWFTIGIGFFIISVVSLSFVYYQSTSERDRLQEDLILARSKLSSIDLLTPTNKQEALEQQLNQAYKDYESDKKKFVQSIEDIAVGNVLYEAARINDVNITQMSSSDIRSEEVKGAPCLVLSLNTSVIGNVDNLVAFIRQLNNELVNVLVKSVSMNISPSGNDKTATASIQIVVYAYEEK